jgi:hypothetical protein
MPVKNITILAPIIGATAVSVGHAIEILEAARDSKDSPETVVAAVEKVSPEVAELVKSAGSLTSGQWGAYLKLLISVLTLALAAAQYRETVAHPPASKAEIAEIVAQAMAQIEEPAVPEPGVPQLDERHGADAHHHDR